MARPAGEEIRIGPLVIRFLVEGQSSGGSVAVFEFDVPAGAKVPVAHSHDEYELAEAKTATARRRERYEHALDRYRDLALRRVVDLAAFTSSS